MENLSETEYKDREWLLEKLQGLCEYNNIFYEDMCKMHTSSLVIILISVQDSPSIANANKIGNLLQKYPTK